MIDSEGIKYSKVVQRVRALEHEPIESVKVGKKHVFALAKSGQYFFWGLNQSGLAMLPSNKVFERPLPLT